MLKREKNKTKNYEILGWSSQGMILFFKYVKPESLDIVNGKLPRRHPHRFAKRSLFFHTW